MSSSINASLTAGLVTTADTSGIINLQSGGTTIVAVTSTGAAVTGTLSSTGNTTLGDASTDTLNVGNGNLVTDASGNVGVGVTPSAAATGYKSLQMYDTTSVGVISSSYGGHLAVNTIIQTGNTWIRGGNSYAPSKYSQFNGAHVWSTAAAAGTTITFTDAMTLDASGNLLVGTTNVADSSGIGFKLLASATAPSMAVVQSASTNGAGSCYNLYSTGAGAYRFYVGAGGTIFATATTITAISDQRLKENVRDLDYGLNEILALQPRRFDWKEGKGSDKKDDVGFVAQEFEKVLPNSVGITKAGEDGIEYKNVNHGELIPTLVKAIQEQQALITSLTARLDEQQAQISVLQGAK